MKKPKFEGVDDELNFQTAFVAASNLLDLAGWHAAKNDDTETLTTVAAMYIKLGEILMQPVHGHFESDEEEDEDEGGEVVQFGFTPTVVPDIVPVEGETDE